MLIQLNAEIWMGILNWLLKYRKEMAEKFCEFGDNEFSQLTQTWLHQRTRNATLEHLRIDRNFGNQLTILNRTEMPLNITDFSSIDIRYLDSGVIQFLGKIQRFLSNVKLLVAYASQDQLDQSKAFLRRMLPLINGIEALNLYYDISDQAIAFFRDEFPNLFYEASILKILYYRGQFQGLDWLFTRREDGQRKTLIIYNCREEILADILQQIRQHFLDPLVPPMCYFVRIWLEQLDGIQATTIENAQREQLIMQTKVHFLMIARCPSDFGEECLDQKFHELTDHEFDDQKRRIKIFYPKIGPMDEATTSGIN